MTVLTSLAALMDEVAQELEDRGVYARLWSAHLRSDAVGLRLLALSTRQTVEPR